MQCNSAVLAAVATVLVAAQNLPKKIGPVIRALMESLQRESNLDLQVALLFQTYIAHSTKAPKLILPTPLF